MRLIVILFLFLLNAQASEGFWPDIVGVEERFYSHIEREDANVSEEASDARLDEKIKAFKSLVTQLKARPYDVQHRKNPFFDPSQAETRRFRLDARVRINSEQGNDLAVERDAIALDDLKLRKQIYTFFVKLAEEWTGLDAAGLSELLAQERKGLEALPVKTYESRWLDTPPPRARSATPFWKTSRSCGRTTPSTTIS